jgi:hypothetical protein
MSLRRKPRRPPPKVVKVLPEVLVERGWHERGMELAQKIRRKLGGEVDLTSAFPDKPPWMRWHTYWRLYQLAA